RKRTCRSSRRENGSFRRNRRKSLLRTADSAGGFFRVSLLSRRSHSREPALKSIGPTWHREQNLPNFPGDNRNRVCKCTSRQALRPAQAGRPFGETVSASCPR